MENSSSTSPTNSSNNSDGPMERSWSGKSSDKVYDCMLSPQSRRLTKEEEEEITPPPKRKSPLDDPAWNEACEAYRSAISEYNRKMEAWWETLDDEQQQWAFYNV